MVVELVFAFSRSLTLTFSVHFRHLLKALENGRDDSFILCVDDLTNSELFASFEL